MLYEAKVLDVKAAPEKKDPPEYKVHYKGWKNTYVPCLPSANTIPFPDPKMRELPFADRVCFKMG